jgi:hypothetical protein
MPPISMKKVLIVILIVIGLSRLDRVIAFASKIYQFFYDSFEPLQTCPRNARLTLVLLALALLYITVFKLLYRKR